MSCKSKLTIQSLVAFYVIEIKDVVIKVIIN